MRIPLAYLKTPLPIEKSNLHIISVSLIPKASNMKRGTVKAPPKSISSENVARVNLLSDVIQAGIITIRDDRVTLRLERLQVIDHPAAEERRAIL